MKASIELPTILVADADPTFRRSIAACLCEAGFRVEAFGDGPATLRHLMFGRSAGVLVTDLALPGLPDGRSLAHEARVLRPDLTVVYISARPADAAQGVPGAHFLRTPYEIATVALTVREALAARETSAPDRDVDRATTAELSGCA